MDWHPVQQAKTPRPTFSSQICEEQHLFLDHSPFVHTWFRDGNYCVPEEAATTKRIFALLAQLIAIQTPAGDLSITPIVRVIQWAAYLPPGRLTERLSWEQLGLRNTMDFYWRIILSENRPPLFRITR